MNENEDQFERFQRKNREEKVRSAKTLDDVPFDLLLLQAKGQFDGEMIPCRPQRPYVKAVQKWEEVLKRLPSSNRAKPRKLDIDRKGISWSYNLDEVNFTESERSKLAKLQEEVRKASSAIKARGWHEHWTGKKFHSVKLAKEKAADLGISGEAWKEFSDRASRKESPNWEWLETFCREL